MLLTIAVDGPVGAGKSTVSDEVCRRLGILHLDTGAMYRAVGLCALKNGIDPGDEEKVSALCRDGKVRVDVEFSGNGQKTLLDGQDVSEDIRTQDAGAAASAVSRYTAVRDMMVRRQQEMAREQSMLLDGRDIGTVVLPDAKLKIYLTASPEIRAQRRMQQLRKKGDETPFEEILREVNARDYQDTHRALTPLRQAEDAVLLDGSELDFEQTVDAILRLVEERYGKAE